MKKAKYSKLVKGYTSNQSSLEHACTCTYAVFAIHVHVEPFLCCLNISSPVSFLSINIIYYGTGFRVGRASPNKMN